MGNRALPASFWDQLSGRKRSATPCRTCSKFLWWEEARPSIIVARCAARVQCNDPEHGCEDWTREPGADDEEGAWPPATVPWWGVVQSARLRRR